MATYEQLKAQAIAAYKAGDDEKAEQIASILKQAKATGGFTDINGVEHVTASLPKKKERTLGEKIVGVGEAALGTVAGGIAGATGQVAGTAKGIGQAIAAGEYGTRKGAERVKREATETAEEFAQPFMPRGEAGQEYLGEVAQTFAPLTYVNPMMAEATAIANLARAARPQVSVATAPARKAAAKAAQVAGEKVGETVGSMTGAVKGMMPENQLQKTMVQAAKESPIEDEAALLRRQQAAELPEPIDLTAGQATRSFAQQQFEREVAKQPELGAPIRERFMDQSEALKHNFDALIGETGAQQIDLPSVGTTVDKALRNQSKIDKAKVTSAYQRAREAGEMESPAELRSVIDEINKNVPEAENAPILKVARQKLVKLGLASESEDGNLVPVAGTLNTVEEFRKSIGASINSQSGPDVHFGRLLKDAVDTDTEGVGGALFKEARDLHKSTADKYKNFGLVRDILGTKRGTNDRQIAIENVFNRSILTSSAEDMNKLKGILQSSGDEGKQAWNELRGATLRHIRDEATKGVARDERGNPIISPAQIDRVISALDKSGKLESIFGDKGAQQIRTINDVTKTLFTSPPGSVNTSNTASVILAAMDMAISGMAGMPAPILSALKLVQKNIKDAKIKARVAKALESKLPADKKIVDIKQDAKNF